MKLYTKKYKSDSRRFDAIKEISYKCDCGHAVEIPRYLRKVNCDWCGYDVYKDKLEREMNKNVRKK